MRLRQIVLVAVALVFGSVPPALAASRVEVSQELVSASFEGAPVSEALDAVRRATGVDIVVPDSVLSKQITLTAQGLSFERFLRRLLEAMDLGGFALVYEPSGAAGRVIVVDRARGAPPGAPAGPPAGPPIPEPASAAPPAEPVYIPPREPPVYIPPASPPVYIPPASPPVYIPPATEPQPSPPPAP